MFYLKLRELTHFWAPQPDRKLAMRNIAKPGLLAYMGSLRPGRLTWNLKITGF